MSWCYEQELLDRYGTAATNFAVELRSAGGDGKERKGRNAGGSGFYRQGRGVRAQQQLLDSRHRSSYVPGARETASEGGGRRRAGCCVAAAPVLL